MIEGAAYRHSEHAGNRADVHKHAVLAMLLSTLTRSETPLDVLDTHAGEGLYRLAHPGRLRWIPDRNSEPVPEPLVPYLDVLAALSGRCEGPLYPGSPWLARAFLRPGDRLVLAEQASGFAECLEGRFGGDDRVRVLRADGWSILRNGSVGHGRQTLVLVDPPYLDHRDYGRAARGLAEAGRRLPDSCLCLWYPILDGRHESMTGAIRSALPKRVVLGEWRFGTRSSGDGMAGSGVLLVNPPEGTGAGLDSLQVWLHRRLGEVRGGRTGVLLPGRS